MSQVKTAGLICFIGPLKQMNGGVVSEESNNVGKGKQDQGYRRKIYIDLSAKKYNNLKNVQYIIKLNQHTITKESIRDTKIATPS